MSKYVTVCGALSHIRNTRNALFSYCSDQTNRYVLDPLTVDLAQKLNR